MSYYGVLAEVAATIGPAPALLTDVPYWAWKLAPT